MKSKILILTLTCFSICSTTFAGPIIILKLDDLKAPNNTCNSLPTIKYLAEKQIKAGFGVIANAFDATSLTTLSPYLNATNSKGEKLFEIWHHGLDHIEPEFKGTSYAYQKAHFDQASEIIKSTLGIQMHSCGTPFNGSDATTYTILSEDPNYRVLMLGSIIPTPTAGFVNLTNRILFENGTGIPDYNYFITHYNANKDRFADYIILQGHPLLWYDDRLVQFKKIIDFLISEGCEFMQPYEYYQSMSVRKPLNETFEKFGVSTLNYKSLFWIEGGTKAKVVDNPNKTGINTSNNVLQIIRAETDSLVSESVAAGLGNKGVYTTSYDLPLSATNCIVELKILKLVDGIVSVRVFPNANVLSTSKIIRVNLPGSPNWQTVQFNLSELVPMLAATSRFAFEIERTGTVAAQKPALTVYIDDVKVLFLNNPLNESYETTNVMNLWKSIPENRIFNEIVANPLIGATNTSTKVMKITKKGDWDTQSDDLIYTNAYPTTLNNINNTVQLKVLYRSSENTGITSTTVGVRMGNDISSDIYQTINVSDNWQTIQFDYSTLPNYKNLFDQNNDTLSTVFSILPRVDKMSDGSPNQDKVVMYVDDIKMISATINSNEKLKPDQIRTFINPANSFLNIQNLPDELCSIRLFNLSGIECMHINTHSINTEIDISTLTSGVYLLLINSSGETHTNKVIKSN